MKEKQQYNNSFAWETAYLKIRWKIVKKYLGSLNAFHKNQYMLDSSA